MQCLVINPDDGGVGFLDSRALPGHDVEPRVGDVERHEVAVEVRVDQDEVVAVCYKCRGSALTWQIGKKTPG